MLWARALHSNAAVVTRCAYPKPNSFGVSTRALEVQDTQTPDRARWETLRYNHSIRTSAEIKQLLRMAAERERRSVASMIKILVLEYAQAHSLKPAACSESAEERAK